jgi:hypothetical protein
MDGPCKSIDPGSFVDHSCSVNERDLTIELMTLPFGASDAFAAAAAERCLRHEAEQDPYDEEPESRLLPLCWGVVNDLWSAHAGDEDAFYRISRSVATFYLSPLWRRSYVDQSARPWEDGNSPPVQVTLYAALAYIHYSDQLAARAGAMAELWSGRAAQAIARSGDPSPTRRIASPGPRKRHRE